MSHLYNDNAFWKRVLKCFKENYLPGSQRCTGCANHAQVCRPLHERQLTKSAALVDRATAPDVSNVDNARPQ